MKICAWCGEIIQEENESHEDRMFFRYGKLCLYFCDDICHKNYIIDKQEHGGKPLYSVVERADA
jgi:hypothetical protein